MTLTALLMAGGESRRMGRDKALLSFAGQPLWARQIELLRELQPQALLISARTRPAWCPPQIDVVLDTLPSRGPLSGLAAALARLHTTHLLALAMDLPVMTAEMLRRLCGMAQPGRGVVPVGDHGFEGLCALYPAEAGPAAAAALAGNDPSLQNFLRTLEQQQRLDRVPLQDPEKALFRNMNTPADWMAGAANWH